MLQSDNEIFENIKIVCLIQVLEIVKNNTILVIQLIRLDIVRNVCVSIFLWHLKSDDYFLNKF